LSSVGPLLVILLESVYIRTVPKYKTHTQTHTHKYTHPLTHRHTVRNVRTLMCNTRLYNTMFYAQENNSHEKNPDSVLSADTLEAKQLLHIFAQSTISQNKNLKFIYGSLTECYSCCGICWFTGITPGVPGSNQSWPKSRAGCQSSLVGCH
jgi:hypothetical protein